MLTATNVLRPNLNGNSKKIEHCLVVYIYRLYIRRRFKLAYTPPQNIIGEL